MSCSHLSQVFPSVGLSVYEKGVPFTKYHRFEVHLPLKRVSIPTFIPFSIITRFDLDESNSLSYIFEGVIIDWNFQIAFKHYFYTPRRSLRH